MSDTQVLRPDEGMSKGAVEEDTFDPRLVRRPQHGSLALQLGHRDQDEMLKDNDTDFPGLMLKPNTPEPCGTRRLSPSNDNATNGVRYARRLPLHA